VITASSASVADRTMPFGVSSVTLTVWGPATGRSFTESTLIVMVPTLTWSRSSVTLNLNESDPK
jgi:hypothetical protein